jgi:beta-lactamase superfamily II metal-dependent hydrolase
MRAHFLPVGQAHATLLEFSCGAALIDAGAQDAEAAEQLLNYLDRFFIDRPDLHRTLDLVLITHNHIDHTFALRQTVEHGVIVKNYVDNGQLKGRGTEGPRWLRANANTDGHSIQVSEVKLQDIAALPQHSGLTNAVIDPINCADTDPHIRVLWGRTDSRPAAWSKQVFDNKNNHSLVTRIDFGQSSFLFLGDLESEAIASLLAFYGEGNGRELLDTDVYQVGHHGSNNATSLELLQAMTPLIAVIPVGNWDFGKGSRNKFTTNAYGHPRKVTLDLLQDNISGTRSEPATVMAATGARKFGSMVVRKRIYATSWDGVVTVRATADGNFRVTRE